MRISFEDMAMEIAKISSLRSEDLHRKVGCTILNKEGRVLAIGYNGLRPNQNAGQMFWSDREKRRKYIIHAETNALSCLTRYDSPYLLVSTLLPCSCCAMNIASHGIQKVIYLDEYLRDQEAINIFKFHNIKIEKYKKCNNFSNEINT
jgi:dCMP deaminase